MGYEFELPENVGDMDLVSGVPAFDLRPQEPGELSGSVTPPEYQTTPIEETPMLWMPVDPISVAARLQCRLVSLALLDTQLSLSINAPLMFLDKADLVIPGSMDEGLGRGDQAAL